MSIKTKLFQVPISIDAKGASDWFDRWLISEVIPLCQENSLDPLLVQFFGDPNFMKDDPNHAEYRSIFKKCRKWSKFYCHTIGDWNRGECICNFCLDGLHCEQCIICLTVKYLMVMSWEYYAWIDGNRVYMIKNHFHEDTEDAYVVLTPEQVDTHFRDCCGVTWQGKKRDSSINVKNS